jgi:glycosyltransferase involved in cell wall biosynthesis
MIRLYGTAELACVPSLYEGFSLPAIQAMSSGLPLVCTNAGAVPEVAGTHGETALIVEPRDAEALKSGLKRILDEPALGRRLAANARNRVLDKFTWAAMAKQTAEQYRILLDEYAARR